MAGNGFRMKSDSEMSPYQKKIEKIENVILCVAEAEKMVAEIGKNLFPGLIKKPLPKRPRPRLNLIRRYDFFAK